MSLYKPGKSPYYHYDFQIQGERFSGSTRSRNKAEARDIERREKDDAKEALKSRRSSHSDPLTIDMAADLFWEQKGEFYNGNAKKTFKASLRWIVVNAGPNRLLRDFSNGLVAELVAKRRGEGVSNATVNRTVTQPLQRLMNRARDAWDQDVPKIRWGAHLLPEPKERVRELRADEEHRLFTAMREDYRPILEFALLSGFRLKECVSLRWADIDWGGQRIEVVGKGSETAQIPMSGDIRELLFPLQAHHHEFVFTYVCRKRRGLRLAGTRLPITYEGLKTEWRRRRPNAEVSDFRFHDNRHTAATRLLRDSGNLKLVQKLLRHKDIATTTKYAHVTDDDLRLAMENAAKSRNKSRTVARTRA